MTNSEVDIFDPQCIVGYHLRNSMKQPLA